MAKAPTFREALSSVTVPHGIKNFVPHYLELLEGETSGNDEFDEEAFVKRASQMEERADVEREKAAKQVLQALREALYLFAIISRAEKDGDRHGAALRATHHYLFTVLHHAGLACRALLENALDFEDYGDVTEYVAHLKKKHRLTDDEAYTLGLVWGDENEHICHRLLEREWRLTVFGGTPVGFLVRDADDRSRICPAAVLCTDNGLVISKYYFFMRILTVLRHLQLATRFVAKEKGQSFNEEEIESMEIFEMDAFHAAAEELFER